MDWVWIAGIRDRLIPDTCHLTSALGRPGDDLLSHALRRSTIGAEGFHVRVRDGIGWGTLAMATGSSGRRAASFSSRSDAAQRGQRRGCLVLAPGLEPGSGMGLVLEGTSSIERLGPVSSTRCRACTPGLSTWWSSTALKRDLVSRRVSRLDAFSGYPFRT